jgi:hypothetical protein
VHLFLAESEHSGLLVRIAAFLVAAAALVVLFAGAALAAKLPFVPPFLRSWRSTESSSPEPVILASAPDQA